MVHLSAGIRKFMNMNFITIRFSKCLVSRGIIVWDSIGGLCLGFLFGLQEMFD